MIASGSLVETSVRSDDLGLHATSLSLHAGGHVVFGPKHVHDLVKNGPGPALSSSGGSIPMVPTTYPRSATMANGWWWSAPRATPRAWRLHLWSTSGSRTRPTSRAGSRRGERGPTGRWIDLGEDGASKCPVPTSVRCWTC